MKYLIQNLKEENKYLNDVIDDNITEIMQILSKHESAQVRKC